MAVIGALRRYKSENQLPLNEPLDHVAVYGNVDGFTDAIAGVMHVESFELLADAPEITTEIADISLDYSTLGPKYGGTVGEFDAAIESGEYELDGDTLSLAGETLEADEFEIREERTYSGAGEMLEADEAIVIVN